MKKERETEKNKPHMTTDIHQNIMVSCEYIWVG